MQLFIIPLPTKLRRDIVTLPSVRPSHPCEHSRINILQWILIKLGTYLVLKRIWNPIDFQRQRSRSQGQIFTVQHPCEHSRINILQWILTKLGTYLVLKRVGSQTSGQLFSNVIDYITITMQFSWLHYITITSILKCNRLNYNYFVNVFDYITDYI